MFPECIREYRDKKNRLLKILDNWGCFLTGVPKQVVLDEVYLQIKIGTKTYYTRLSKTLYKELCKIFQADRMFVKIG